MVSCYLIVLLLCKTTVIDTQLFSAFLLPFSLALIMLGLGLSLTRSDFENILKHPRALGVGLFAQMVGLPIVAFLIALIAPSLSPELKVGIVLLAACPGGATSNLLNYWLNGNLALSVSITTVNSFITQFTIPILVNIALFAFMNKEKDIDLPILETFIQILLITVIPTIIGILIRSYAPVFAEKVRKPLKYIMTALMAVALIGAIFIEKNDQISIPVGDYWLLLPLTILLNVGGMLVGFYMGKYYKLGLRNQTTIAIEVGLQNTILAIAVATGPKMLNNPAFAIPAAMYALYSFFTTAGFGIYVNRQNLNWKWLNRRLKKKRV